MTKPHDEMKPEQLKEMLEEWGKSIQSLAEQSPADRANLGKPAPKSQADVLKEMKSVFKGANSGPYGKIT